MRRIFDSHFHVIDPRFPLIPNRGYLPEAFTCADYRDRVDGLGIAGGAVVSGSFQGFDQRYLTAALRELGPAFVGVTQLPADAGADEIVRLHDAGVRAVRFNLRRGGSAAVDGLETFARRIHNLVGWHVELYADAADIDALRATLLRLPAVVIDHMGLSRDGLPTLVELAEQGVHIKATGFGRLDFDPGPALRMLVAANPKALLFGTDLPSTRAPRPFEDRDIDRVVEAVGNEFAADVLYRNAVALYGPLAAADSGATEPRHEGNNEP